MRSTKVSARAGRDAGYQLPDALEKFSQRFLAERTKADGIAPEHPLFVAIETPLAEPLRQRSDDRLRHDGNSVPWRREKMPPWRAGLTIRLELPDAALCSENGEALVAAIRNLLPVAMMTNLPDTDLSSTAFFRREPASSPTPRCC